MHTDRQARPGKPYLPQRWCSSSHIQVLAKLHAVGTTLLRCQSRQYRVSTNFLLVCFIHGWGCILVLQTYLNLPLYPISAAQSQPTNSYLYAACANRLISLSSEV